MDGADKYFSDMLSLLYEDMNKNKDIIYTGLVENRHINSIPESLFRDYFLPRFIGQINDPQWVVHWISIAGTPTSDVNVHSDISKEYLFTVPGILNSNFIINNKGLGFNDIFTRYRQLSNNIPMEGDRFLYDILGVKSDEVLTSNTNNLEAISTWEYILNRYSLLHKDTTNPNVKENNDFFEY